MQNNLDPTREDILHVVDTINYEWSDIAFNTKSTECFTPVIYQEGHGVGYLKVMGEIVWDADNDQREYIGEDVKEDLLTFITKELIGISNTLRMTLRNLPVLPTEYKP